VYHDKRWDKTRHGYFEQPMHYRGQQPLRASGVAATLDGLRETPSSGSSLIPSEIAPRVALVEGSGPGLSGETQTLLRTRLRAAALVLCLGSLAFLIRSLLSPHTRLPDPALERSENFLTWFHVFHVTVLGLVSYKLCWRCNLSLGALRVAETIIFGLTALFFALVQHIGTRACLILGLTPFNPVGMWFCLMFTYSIYIPNSWRRAAAVMGLMAAAPVAVMIFDQYRYGDAVRGTSFDHLSGVALFMAVGFGSCTYGTYIINSLRREAFEAKQLGQYRLRHLIGSGGMGEVYLAEHQLLKRPCAIKVIRPGKAQDPRALARFEREVRATARLSHWNTVEIFDYGAAQDGTFFYVMEFLPGLSLADLVERFGPLPPERVIYLLRQTCDALAEAHSLGLVHRDIKPGNIFAAQRGGVFDVAKLLDFGLAKPAAQIASPQLTQEGTITGSPLYMSPEQALGESEPDARSDIYSLGAVAYFLLTGRPPFDNENPMRVMVSHAHDEVVPPTRIRPDIPADLEQVVLRTLAKNPAERFPSALALGRALEECESARDWSREQAAAWWAQVEQPATVAAG
jgi:eukaryotic-like serine/threonine-protein kinase